MRGRCGSATACKSVRRMSSAFVIPAADAARDRARSSSGWRYRLVFFTLRRVPYMTAARTRTWTARRRGARRCATGSRSSTPTVAAVDAGCPTSLGRSRDGSQRVRGLARRLVDGDRTRAPRRAPRFGPTRGESHRVCARLVKSRLPPSGGCDLSDPRSGKSRGGAMSHAARRLLRWRSRSHGTLPRG